MALVNNKEARLVVVGGMRLRPGNNQVDNKRWAEAKKGSQVQKMIDEKMLVEGGTATGGSDDPTQGTLEDAKGVLSETLDPKLLDQWEAAEKKGRDRAGFYALVDAQRKALADAEAKKEDE